MRAGDGNAAQGLYDSLPTQNHKAELRDGEEDGERQQTEISSPKQAGKHAPIGAAEHKPSGRSGNSQADDDANPAPVHGSWTSFSATDASSAASTRSC